MDTIPQDTPLKQCTVCKNTFPATPEFFYRNKTEKSGLQRWCKECHKAYHGRLDVQEKRKAYLERTDVQERVKAYRQRPDVRKRVHIYLSRPDIQERVQIQRQVRIHTRRAHQRSIAGSYTTQQIQDLLRRQKYKCYYCNAKFEKRRGKYIYHVDHTFPVSRIAGMDIPANSIDYLVLACPHCNMSKHDKFPWEFPEGGRLL